MADSLSKYRSMRDFKSTPEPKGKAKKSKSGRLFIIQKHDATRLHYDFRLELDGVLLSWAVTRGPSLNPADKRLAVQTEDHPVEYGGFEGVIPSGYGAGTVMLWDRGEWMPQDDPHEGLKKGQLKFVLNGERLKGGFVLIRLKPRPGEKPGRSNWLLIKERDEWAKDEVIATETWTTSVKTKRSLEKIEKEGDAYTRGKMYSPETESRKDAKPKKADMATTKPAKATTKKAKGAAKKSPAKKPVLNRGPRAAPRFIAPQLAQLVDAPPQGDDWLHETKFDGYRILAVVRDGVATLWTRNQKDWTHKYRRIAQATQDIGQRNAVYDGELVALDAKGKAAFSSIQSAGEDESATLQFHIFDLLNEDGEDTSGLPLIERKERLEALLADPPKGIHYSDHVVGGGDKVFANACSMKMEGIISKQASARYVSGRAGFWTKSKCVGNDEFVIGGYRLSDKAGRPFRSLILGEFKGDKLVYRGRVGTGFNDETFATLTPQLESRVRKTSPFESEPSEARRNAVWVEPELVAQIAYFEQTPDGYLRHPSYLGLREDKPAKEVKVATRTSEKPAPSAPARQTTAKQTKAIQPKAKPAKAKEATGPMGVRLTSPGKVLWSEPGLTKTDLAAYYAAHADLILPHLKDRPLSFVRCPEGSDGDCFFQKHHVLSTPDEIETVGIREKNGKTSEYLIIRSKKGLISAAQVGALELHVWGSRGDDVDKPERIIFDLDPDEDLDFATVRNAAIEVRDVLGALGLITFPMLTGGKGIHVIAPIARRNSWDEVKTFCHNVANKLEAIAPDRYVSNMSKAKRRGRIFVDYLRNERGSTAVCPFSPRRKPNASVATPISWAELPRIQSANAFTIQTIDKRLTSLKADPWQGYAAASRQTLTAARLDAVAAS